MTALEKVRRRAESDAKTYGYYLCPEKEMLKELLEGLKENEDRYGYPLCPCRLGTGQFEIDRDIICPCDYRDPDVLEFGYCYCGLYVREDVVKGENPIQQIPERRPLEKQERAYRADTGEITETKESNAEKKILETHDMVISDTNRKFWYCQQCGYVCFREDPPYVCPICKAKREMFAKVSFGLNIRISKKQKE